jgi:hypothetical protein
MTLVLGSVLAVGLSGLTVTTEARADDSTEPVFSPSVTVSPPDTEEVLGARDPHGRYRPAGTLKPLTMVVLMNNLEDPAVAGTAGDPAQAAAMSRTPTPTLSPSTPYRGDDVQFGWLGPTLALLIVAAVGALGAVFLIRRNSGGGGRHSR